jgi:hypothetical protein
MKKCIMGLLFFAFAALACPAQTPVKMVCRVLDGSNNFLQPNETLLKVGDSWQACHAIVETGKTENAAAPAAPAPAAPVMYVVSPTPTPGPTSAQPVPAAPVVYVVSPTPGPIAAQPVSAARPNRLVAVRRATFSTGYLFTSAAAVGGYGLTSSHVSTNGGFLQPVINVNQYVGVVTNIDAIYKSVFGTNVFLLTYGGGVQGYPLGRRYSLVPFSRVVLGAGTIHVSGTGTTTGFDWQVGGGVDWRPRREGRFGLRLGQFDYGRLRLPMSYYGSSVSVSQIKVGTGINF